MRACTHHLPPNHTPSTRRVSCQRHAVTMPMRAVAIPPSTPSMYPGHIRRRSKRSTDPTKSPPPRATLTRRALPTRAVAIRPSNPLIYPGHIRKSSKRSTGPTKSPPRGGASAMRGGLRPLFRATEPINVFSERNTVNFLHLLYLRAAQVTECIHDECSLAFVNNSWRPAH